MMPLTFPIPVGQLKMQAEQKAAISKAQLLEDVAALDRYNSDVNGVNDRATEALATALLETHGPKRKDWIKWWSELIETSTNLVPRPRDPDRQGETSTNSLRETSHAPRLRGGTPVWTLSGLHEIESLRTGDQVLTQDTDTGRLELPGRCSRFARRRTADQDDRHWETRSIEATALERFWVAGKGWVMAGDLKAGRSDPLDQRPAAT